MVNCFVSNEISYHERYMHIKDIRIRDPFVFVESTICWEQQGKISGARAAI